MVFTINSYPVAHRATLQKCIRLSAEQTLSAELILTKVVFHIPACVTIGEAALKSFIYYLCVHLALKNR